MTNVAGFVPYPVGSACEDLVGKCRDEAQQLPVRLLQLIELTRLGGVREERVLFVAHLLLQSVVNQHDEELNFGLFQVEQSHAVVSELSQFAQNLVVAMLAVLH